MAAVITGGVDKARETAETSGLPVYAADVGQVLAEVYERAMAVRVVFPDPEEDAAQVYEAGVRFALEAVAEELT